MNFLRLEADRLMLRLLIAFFFIVILKLWLSYVFLPFGEDQKIFFASAKIAPASNIFTLLSSALHSWELKPVLNRLSYLILFKGTAKLVDPSNISGFEVGARVLSTLFIFATSYIFVFSKWFAAFSKDLKLVLFSFISIIFLTSTYEAALQAEEVANLVLLLSAALASALSPITLILSGFLSSSLFYIKGIEILSVMLIPALIFFTHRSQTPWSDSFRFGGGALLGLAALTITIFLRSPINLTDLMEVAQNRTTGQSASLYHFLKTMLYRAVMDAPILICLLISAPMALSRALNSSKRNYFYPFFLLFLCTSVFSIYSKRGLFTYHFSSFVPFILFTSLTAAFDFEPENSRTRKFSRLLTGIFFLAFGGVVHHFFFTQANHRITDGRFIQYGLFAMLLTQLFFRKFSKDLKSATVLLILVMQMLHFNAESFEKVQAYKGQALNDERLHGKLSEVLKIPENEVVLYLTDGVPTYYLPFKSACRHFFPVVKSWDPGTKSANEFKNCFERYDGNYIFHNPEWYRLDETAMLKLKKNYSIVYEEKRTSRPLLIYRRNTL